MIILYILAGLLVLYILVTLALFLGFLPTCFGIKLPIGGVFGSILSLVLLWKAVEDV